ncbi:hypothetical protein VNI00_009901 [Paramarasmius palmivorus]|uniref:Uncharacterized protein n=1 Tax=Paramarasmius palmivorus TaxID=297713 RepID=A0AAW0CMH6_9AGAR
MASSEPPVILITGCSTGLGRSLSSEALSRGMRVIATARRLEAIDDLREKGAETLTLDVSTSREALMEFAREAIGIFGQVDTLVNNAGYLLAGAIEEVAEEQMRAQFDTNFFGIINVTCAFLPHFRERRTGTIINISSMGGYLALSGCAIYCATKAALDCISAAWSKELAPFNIRTMSVALGAFRTAVAGSNTKVCENQIEGYVEPREFLACFQGSSGKERGDPDKASKKLLDLIALRDNDGVLLKLPLHLAMGEDAVDNTVKVQSERRKESEDWRIHGCGTDFEDVVLIDTGGRW